MTMRSITPLRQIEDRTSRQLSAGTQKGHVTRTLQREMLPKQTAAPSCPARTAVRAKGNTGSRGTINCRHLPAE